MMNKIERTAELLSRFPSIGKKTALRLVYFLLNEPEQFATQLSNELSDLHQKIKPCTICGHLTEHDTCDICTNSKRNHRQICVLATSQDINALELSQSYEGVYHVLGGLISPLEGIGPNQLRFDALKTRIQKENIQEIILATSPTLEGDSTARYIYEIYKSHDIQFTRIAQGMPMGGDFEYMDKFTIAHALQARTPVQ